MRFPVTPNVSARSAGDALRLIIPAYRIGSRRSLRLLNDAESHHERDFHLRRWSRAALAAVDIDLKVTGLENLDSAKPHLVLPLHESLVDVPLLIDTLRTPMTFVARSELDYEKPFAGLLSACRQILIDPETHGSLRTVVREAALLQAQGRSIVVFPQGSVLGIETGFQGGAGAVAEKLELPVLPVVIAGSHRVWERPFGSLVRRHEPVYVEVMKPRHLGGPDSYRRLEREMKAIALSNSWASPRHFVPERDGFWDGYRFTIDSDYPELAEQVRGHRAERGSAASEARLAES